MAKPITVGVIGLGRAGWDIHVKRIREDERFQITAASDIQQDRCDEAQTEFGCHTFTDVDRFFNEASCELVVVASQSVDHARHTIEAFKRGCHVVVEKPMAISSAEAATMIEAAEAAGKKLLVHQNYRYRPDVRHIQEVIRSGRLGHIFEIRIRALSFARRNDWQTLQKYGGGNLNNSGSHFIDAALLFLDAPIKRMFTDLKLTTDAGNTDDHAKLVFKGDNGRVIDLEVSTSCAFDEPKWTLLGTAGTLRSDGVNSEIRYFDPGKLQPLEVDERPPAGREYGNRDEIPWQQESRPSTADSASDFYDNVFAVIREGQNMDIAPAHVLEVMRVIETTHRENPPSQRLVFAPVGSLE